MTGDRSARLVVPALAVWLGAGFAASAARTLVVGAVAAGGAGLSALLIGRSTRMRAVGRLLVVASACLVAGVLCVAIRADARATGPLHRLAVSRAQVRVVAVVTSDPVRRSSGVLGARRVTGGFVVRLRVERVEVATGEWVRTRHPVIAYAERGDWANRLPGERVLVAGRLAPSDDRLAVAVLRAPAGPTRLAAASWPQRAAGRLRAALRDAVAGLPDGTRGLLPALVDGDTSLLDARTKDEFRRSGLSHVLVVSGTNCAIVLAVALALLRSLRVPPLPACGLAALVLAGFVVLARPSPSVLRAAAMGSIGLVAIASGRERRGLPVLSAAVFVVLLVDPALARSAGFALSVAATGGLVVLAPRWRAALAERWPPWLADAVAVPLAAQAACLPALALLFGRIGIVALPANVLAMPAVGVSTIGGVLVAALGLVSPVLAAMLARLVAVPAGWILFVARRAARLPGAQLPFPSGWWGACVAVALVLTTAYVVRRPVWRRLVTAAVAPALLAATVPALVHPAWPPTGWRFVACDVGQGDALVVRGQGADLVVDAGPEPAAVQHCLSDLGVRRVGLLLLTHLHADHVEGVPGVLATARVARVATGPLDEPVDELRRVRGWLHSRGLALDRTAPGQVWSLPGISVRVLGPAAAFHGTDSDPNNSSVVAVVEAHGVRLLLTGDAEQPAQRALLAAGALPRVDVLKVAHHGSDRQLPEFVTGSHARFAVASVGRDNPYGHPAPRTLGLVAAAGMRGYRTDIDGAVAIAVRGGKVIAVGRRGRGTPPQPGRIRFGPKLTFAALCVSARSAPARGPPCDPSGVTSTGPAVLTLVSGDEELLVSRAVAEVCAAALAADPQADVRDHDAEALDPGLLLDLRTPSLFGGHRVLVVRMRAAVSDDVKAALLDLIAEPQDDVSLVVVHPGGNTGKVIADACKAAKARVVTCAKVTRDRDRLAFAQAEFALLGRPASEQACRAIVGAVAGGLRELAAACAQLAADVADDLDEDAVRRYFRGRGDPSSFDVAEHAVAGQVGSAVSVLREALAGPDRDRVPAGVVAALAWTLRSIARVASASRGSAEQVAAELKVKPWQVDKARRQARGWTPAALAAAHRVVAEADLAVKGGGAHAAYAAERAVVAVGEYAAGR